jgi:hypothetical protein
MERGFALHRGWAEADHASMKRERALEVSSKRRCAMRSRPALLATGGLAIWMTAKSWGMLNSTGLFLGAFGAFGHFMFHNGEESLLTYNRAGGGKGTTLIQPNLCALE